MNKFSFQTKLTVNLVTFSFFAMLICAGMSYFFLKEGLNHEVVQSLNLRMETVKTALKIAGAGAVKQQDDSMDRWSTRYLNRITIDEQTIQKVVAENQVDKSKHNVQYPTFLAEGKPVDTHEFADRLADESGNVVSLMALTPEGLVRVSTSLRKADGSRAVGTFVPATSPVVQSVVAGKRFSGVATVLGKPFITAYEPLRHNGKVVGVLFFGRPETTIGKIVEYLAGEKILETGYFYILNPAGKFILHPFQQDENVLEVTDLDGKPTYKQILEQQNGMIEYRTFNPETQSPQDKIALFHTFPELGWTVVASLNSSEAYASLARLKQIMIFIIGGLTLFIGIASYFMGAPMARRLTSIEDRIAASVEVTTADAKLVNTVSDSLSSGVSRQASALQETMSALEEIRATMQTNQNSTESARLASDSLAEVSTHGKKSLDTLAEAIQEIREGNSRVSSQVDLSYDEIGKILDLIAEIEVKTKVINEIVFQTKLLSFNASVEAARAGDAGRGFSVVAEEIGRLANLSGTSAHEINATLSHNRQTITQIIESAKSQVYDLISEADKKVNVGVDMTVTSQEAFSRIQSDVEKVNRLMKEIAVASAEQSRGISEIATAMSEIDTTSQEHSNLAQEANGLATSLSANSVTLDQAWTELHQFIKGGAAGPAGHQSAAAAQPTDFTNRHKSHKAA